MLSEIFYWIFNMSIAASLTGLLVMLLLLPKRLPRRIAVFLWAIPFLRMALPFGLNSPFSVMSLLSRLSTRTVVICSPAEGVSFSMMNLTGAAETYFPITYKIDLLADFFRICSVVWLLGFCAAVLVLAAGYLLAWRNIRSAQHLRDNIYFCENLTSPAVYGFLRPKIILPASFRGREANLILLHETIHLHRGDNLWRLLALLLTAVHWFNPLSLVFLKRFLSDLELACDECVLARLGDSRRKEYARTLLECRQSAPILISGFGGAKLRPRIERILSYRNMTRLSLAAGSTFVLVIFYILLTNAS